MALAASPRLDVELLERRAVDGVEAGRELLGLAGRQHGVDRPVLVGAEGFDLGLAVAHEAQGDGLHAAGRAGARQLAPEHRRQREADEIVEGAAGEVGGDEGAVDVARLAQGGKDRLLGDGVEGDALDLGVLLQRLLLLEDLQDVPGDRLAFPIRVGGEDELVGLFDRVRDFLHDFLGLRVDVPVHLEVFVGLHRAVLGRQIAHMPERGNDLVAAAQVLVDGLGLGSRFDDYDVHL